MALSGEVIPMLITLGNEVTNSYIPREECTSTAKSYFSFMLAFGLFCFWGKKEQNKPQ